MGYEIDEAEVAYWGRCPECLSEEQESTLVDSSTRPRQDRWSAASQEISNIQPAKK
jgi:hypothetical protein